MSAHTERACLTAALLACLAPDARAQGPCNLQWVPPLVDPQLDDIVYATTVFDEGSGPALYLGGEFTALNGNSCRAIARYDGINWVQVGAGLLSQVNALCAYDDGSGAGPALFACGSFHHDGLGNPLSRIAKWDGANWLALGSGLATGASPTATCMAVYDDGSGPALYVGGGFYTAGGVPAEHIARWNGASWSAVGGGISGGAVTVRCMSVHDDGTGPALYVGGTFASAGGLPASGIARWNGTTWSALGSGLSNTTGWSAEVLDTASVDLGAGPELVVCGRFDTAGGQPCVGLAHWNGASWIPFPHSFDDDVQFLHELDYGARRVLAISSGGILARWDGQIWQPIPGDFGASPQLYGTAAAMAIYDDGFGPELYAAGGFTQIDSQPIGYIGRLPGLGSPPAFAQQPASQNIPDGLPVVFQSSLSNPGTLGYQWTWFGNPLVDSANISGSTTDTLTIQSVAPALAGDYQLRVTSGCMEGLSAIAVLGVTPGTGQSFCFGNLTEPGMTTFCPCFNFGGPSRGCANSANDDGARLVASGSTAPDPTSGTDTVALGCAGMTNTSLVVFLQGDALAGGGVILGDGVRCAGGQLVRLSTGPAPFGQASFPAPGGPSLSQAGGVTLGSGVTRYYQVWYRDSANYCTGSTSNLSSGIRLVW